MKQKTIHLFLLAWLFSFQCFAGKDKDFKYSIADIPDSLRKNADAVVREDKMEFEVLSLGKSRMKHTYAVTILNSKADDYAIVRLYYDEGMSRIEGLNAKVYNAFGMDVGTLKNKDIKDISAYDGVSMASDTRVKIFGLENATYPYTIYYEYTKVDNNTMFYPSWYGQGKTNLAVQQSSYKVIMPADMKLHYQEKNLQKTVRKSRSDSKDIYFWEATNLVAHEDEPYGDIEEELMPHVKLRPDQFSIAGYVGSFDTWENMGKWQNQLTKGRGQLPPATVAKIKALTQGISSKREQVKKVYEYLQQNTRYVSIQLGIGGWQPFPADHVDKNGYGDCKALSNYTHSALAAIGIPSYYTLVRAGKGKNIDKDFPGRQFNHAFLCVPLEQDTVWLECTSQTNPFNYLGSFTDDRDVLLCTPEGGKLVHTPVYKKEDNLMIRTADVVIDKSGNATAKLAELTTAQQHDRIRGIVFDNKEDQKKRLYNYFDIPSFNITDYELQWEKTEMPSFSIKADLDIPNCASKSGKRLFIKPNLLSRWTYVPKKVEDRKSSVISKSAFTDMDTISFEIPENYHVEHLPKPVSFSTVFGSYESKMEVVDGKLIYTRKVEIEKGKFPKESYDDYVSFHKKIVKADRAKAVFVDKT